MNENYNDEKSQFLILASESILRGQNRYTAVRYLAKKASDIYANSCQNSLGELGSVAVRGAILALGSSPQNE